MFFFFFFSSRRRHTRFDCDWSSDVCSSDLGKSPRDCPSCANGRLGLKLGKFGAFIGCSNYPECRFTRKLGIVDPEAEDRKSTRLNSSHSQISYAVFCLKKKKNKKNKKIIDK